MKSSALVPLCLLVALTCPGCLYVTAKGAFGADLDPAAIDKILPGKSTKGDVLRLLGPPEEYVRSEVLSSMLDEESRIVGAIHLGNRAHDAFTYQFDRVQASGTFLLLFGTFVGVAESDIVLVLFDDSDVVQEISVRLGE